MISINAKPMLVQNKIDSLVKILTGLHVKVDSLQVISHNTEIGQSYFNQIMYLQLTIFVVIITIILAIITVISWRIIIVPFMREAKAIRAEMKTLITNQAKDFDDYKVEMEVRHKNLLKQQRIIARQAMRGMYLGIEKKFTALKIMWALRLANSYFDDNEIESSIGWAKRANIDFENMGNGKFGSNFDEVISLVNILKGKNTDFVKILTEMEKKCYEEKYSMKKAEDQPPVDTNS